MVYDNTNKEQFNKDIIRTIEENEQYAEMRCLEIDGSRYPDMHKDLVDCFSIFWVPKAIKDKYLHEKLLKERRDYFGDDHVRGSYVSLGDLFLYLAKSAKNSIPNSSIENHIHTIFRSLKYYRTNVHQKKNRITDINQNGYYFKNDDGQMMYSMFGFPRGKEEHRLVIETMLKQYIWLYSKGFYKKGICIGFEER